MAAPTEPVSATVATFLNTRATPSKQTSVVFEDLSVEGWGKGIQTAPTVLTTLCSWANVLNPRTYTEKQPWRTLLHSFCGTLAPGEMLLVIGKPGSGCTTFLKTLASLRGEYKGTNGSLKYDGSESSNDTGHTLTTFCAEEDSHLPNLTVEETLGFAVRSTWPSDTPKPTIDTAVRSLTRSVGLDHVLQTKVGDAAVRGVSGGERRRVSLAEAIATCPDILCLDNPTNGLDSSNALEFIQMARELTRQQGSVTAMSLYQGSNAMVPLFDKVLVIHSGRQIFYGKALEAKTYFEQLGFLCPERTTYTDFLNSMTAEPQLRHVRPGLEHAVPRTARQFEEAFRNSPYFTAVREAIQRETTREYQPVVARPQYSLPIYRQFAECTVRQMKVLFRDYGTWQMEAACLIVQSLALGTVYRDQKRDTGSLFLLSSSMFILTLIPGLQAMNEFGNTFAQRNLVIRHKSYRLYRPLSYSLALVMADVPWKVLIIVYNLPQYFLTGFQKPASKFFTWFIISYIDHMALAMIFRGIAVFSSSINRAVLPVGALVTAMIAYAGLYIPIPQMQIWLSWLRFLSPLHYAYEASMVNEFGNLDYTCSPADFVPTGSQYNNLQNQVCAIPGAVSGSSTVPGRAYVASQYAFRVPHLWRNVGINAAFFVAFTIVTAIGMERYKVAAGKLATIFYERELKNHISDQHLSGSDSETGVARDEKVIPVDGGVVESKMSQPLTDHTHRTLVWKDICLDINAQEGPRRLLDNISGRIESGKLTALMGMSGAGKSTLLNALAGRIEFGSLSGSLYLDGKPLPKSFRRIMGYVQQQDVHLPTQTVREALQMTARLRRPQSIPLAEKDAYVEDVIRILDMEDIADALIGVPGAGMNLEQRKRVTIGVELSAMPDILFLDEPTSGLDGQSAVKIVRLLGKLAASGQTVLCTIHQPAAEVIKAFDGLILLVRGGNVAYQGPFGDECSTAMEYFGRYARSCGPEENPAEYLLDIVGAGSRSEAAQDWVTLWQESPEKSDLDRLLAVSSDNSGKAWSGPTEHTYATSFWFQLRVILKRTWLFSWRDPSYFTSMLTMNIIQALVNGLTYLNSDHSQQGTYNRVFSVFVALIVGPPLGLMVIPRYLAIRDLFLLREKASHTYHWLAFVLSAIIVELPYSIVTSFVYWILWYFTAGYTASPSRAGYAFLVYELFAVFLRSLAQLCASLMPTMGGAFTANGFFFMFVNMFSGTLVPRLMTPTGWRWYFYVSPLFYFTEGITTSVLEGFQIVCHSDETSTFQPPSSQTCQQYAASFLQNASGYVMNPDAVTNCSYCRYKDGQSYYAQYGYEFVNRHKDIGIFIGFIAFNYTMVIVLTYLTKVKSWRRK